MQKDVALSLPFNCTLGNSGDSKHVQQLAGSFQAATRSPEHIELIAPPLCQNGRPLPCRQRRKLTRQSSWTCCCEGHCSCGSQKYHWTFAANYVELTRLVWGEIKPKALFLFTMCFHVLPFKRASTRQGKAKGKAKAKEAKEAKAKAKSVPLAPNLGVPTWKFHQQHLIKRRKKTDCDWFDGWTKVCFISFLPWLMIQGWYCQRYVTFHASLGKSTQENAVCKLELCGR